jgi:DNA repair exonuclease SbcCD ATPase subunit
MLNSLFIKLYQSHKDTELHFHPGVNGIIGKSLSGKTAIIRAIKWLITNRPSGFKFHSKFASKKRKTAVMLVTRDGNKVTLAKQGTKGMYEVDRIDSNAEPLQFKKIGKQVPDIVKDKLNLTELNIQEQFDSPFLILSSAGEIAKTVNRVTQIDDIDKWIKLINRSINVFSGRINVYTEDLESIDDELEAFEPLDKVAKKLGTLKHIQKKIDRLLADHESISHLVVNIKRLQTTIDSKDGYITAKRNVEKIIAMQENLALLSAEKQLIKAYLQRQRELELAEEQKSRYIKKYSRIIRKEKLCPTCFKPVKAKDVRDIINGLHTIIGHPRHK